MVFWKRQGSTTRSARECVFRAVSAIGPVWDNTGVMALTAGVPLISHGAHACLSSGELGLPSRATHRLP